FLQAAGIRVKMRPLERAGFFKAYQEKKLKNLLYSISGAFGNAAIRLETFVVGGGPFVYGSYSDIDGALSRASRRARPEATRGDSPSDPAAGPREGDLRADLGA